MDSCPAVSVQCLCSGLQQKKTTCTQAVDVTRCTVWSVCLLGAKHHRLNTRACVCLCLWHSAALCSGTHQHMHTSACGAPQGQPWFLLRLPRQGKGFDPAAQATDCPMCHGQAQITVKKWVRSGQPRISVQEVCPGCRGTGKSELRLCAR